MKKIKNNTYFFQELSTVILNISNKKIKMILDYNLLYVYLLKSLLILKTFL
jgi:hypothetical protein